MGDRERDRGVASVILELELSDEDSLLDIDLDTLRLGGFLFLS